MNVLVEWVTTMPRTDSPSSKLTRQPRASRYIRANASTTSGTIPESQSCSPDAVPADRIHMDRRHGVRGCSNEACPHAPERRARREDTERRERGDQDDAVRQPGRIDPVENERAAVESTDPGGVREEPISPLPSIAPRREAASRPPLRPRRASSGPSRLPAAGRGRRRPRPRPLRTRRCTPSAASASASTRSRQGACASPKSGQQGERRWRTPPPRDGSRPRSARFRATRRELVSRTAKATIPSAGTIETRTATRPESPRGRNGSIEIPQTRRRRNAAPG